MILLISSSQSKQLGCANLQRIFVFAVSGVVELSNPRQWAGNFELCGSTDWKGFWVFDPLESEVK